MSTSIENIQYKEKVILFLTSPTSLKRYRMLLHNFKQIEKLGYDIITLSTSDFLPDYISNRSKMVIYDFNKATCSSKVYYEYFKKSGNGYFYMFQNPGHTIKFFPNTHFPSLLRNTRTLIHIAKCFDYKKYFFVEDDHFFDDEDLNIINNLYEELNCTDLIVHTFSRDGKGGENVYCSYFHYGNSFKMSQIFKNVAYTENDFVNKSGDIYLHFYEYVFKKLVNTFKTEDFTISEKTQELSYFYKKSNLNQNYSFLNIDDMSRCSIIYDCYKNLMFYYHSIGLQSPINIKIFVDNQMLCNTDLNPGCWFSIPMSIDSIHNTKVILNNKIVKNYKDLDLDDVVYNSEFTI